MDTPKTELLTFAVRGSRGDMYEITAQRSGDNLTVRCSCPAGAKGTHCKHRIALLTGDVTELASGNSDDVTRLGRLADGTDVAAALADLARLETDFADIRRQVAAAKKRLGRTMQD